MPRVNRVDLLNVLETVGPGLAVRDTVEQSSCYVFQDGWVITFNEEVAARCRTPLPPDLTGAVDARPLLEALRRFTLDFVDLDVEDGVLVVREARRRVRVRMEAEIVLPVDKVDPPRGWQSLTPAFSEGLKVVAQTAGTNTEEFLTVCIHVHPKYLEATDRFQATRYHVDTGATEPFLVREKSVRQVPVLGMTKFCETESWVHFRNPSGLVLSVRRFAEAYPDLGKFFEFRGEKVVLPQGAAPAAKLAEIFTSEDKDNNKVTVALKHGLMVVSGRGSAGDAEEELETAYHGPALQFRISPTLLEKVVAEHKECEVGPTKLRADGERWEYITCLFTAEEKKSGKAKPEAADSPADGEVERPPPTAKPTGRAKRPDPIPF